MPQHHLDLLSVQLRVQFPVLLLELSLSFALSFCRGASWAAAAMAKSLPGTWYT